MSRLSRAAIACLLVIGTGLASAQDDVASAVEGVRMALAHGENSRALTLARSAVQRYPESAAVRLWLGNALRAAGDLRAAAAAYRRADEIAPDDPAVLLATGSLRELVGDLRAAAAAYERAIEVAPELAIAWRAAGNLQMRARDHARAAHYLRGAVERAPDDLDSRYLLGLATYFGGDTEAAATLFEAALELEPTHVPSSYALGVVLADRPEFHERALTLLRRALAADFEAIEATYLIGRIFADRGEHEAAIEQLGRTLELDPGHADATYRLAQAQARAGRRDEAAATMERFRVLQQRFNEREALDKQVKTLRNALADALRAGEPAAIEAALQALLEATPDDPQTLISAAKVWISAGLVPAALDAATAASQLAPADWEAHYFRGLALAISGQRSEAVVALRASLQRNPLFADTWVVLGNTLVAMDQDDSAIQAYLAAIELETDNPVYWLNLATAYEKTGRTDLARQAVETVERLRNERDGESR